jgi:hypothetical protein
MSNAPRGHSAENIGEKWGPHSQPRLIFQRNTGCFCDVGDFAIFL